MELDRVLQNADMSEKEAKVYLALLEKGTATAYSVALKAGVKRPTTYALLDELAERGVVHVVPKSNKKTYRPTPPETLINRQKAKVNDLERILPELKAKESTGAGKTAVKYFEGVEGVKKVLDYKLDELAGGEIVGFYAKTTDEIMDRFDNYEKYNKKLKKKNITMRGVAPADETLERFRETDDKFGRVIREIDDDTYSSDVAIEIGPTFVRIFDPLNLQGLVIENGSLAETMREIFEIVWDESEKRVR